MKFQFNESTPLASFNPKVMEEVLEFHKTLPAYKETPLVTLKSLAESLQLKNILIKDESKRFHLNAFKVLGSSYALSKQLDPAKKHTFATATAGNHGKGVAWSAKLFGQEAVIYLPKGSPLYKRDRLRLLGAHAEISSLDYDDTVKWCAGEAEARGWILMQDTAWEGYTSIPTLIMQGYLTCLSEILHQLEEKPTHIILQAGVGSLAGAIAAAIKQVIDLKVIIVEPATADCFFQSARAGKIASSSATPSTSMAGLACREVNPLAWPLLKTAADCFTTCSDETADLGIRIYKDFGIPSGPSGACTLGLLAEIPPSLKESLCLNSSSTVLLINTEGDVDAF